MKCYLCGSHHNLGIAVLIVEQVIFLCEKCAAERKQSAIVLNLNALGKSIERNFSVRDRTQIYNQRCPGCKTTLEQFFKTETPGCFQCRDFFTPIILFLINYMENEREFILCPEYAEAPEITPEKKPAINPALLHVGDDPHFKIMHLKERLEALIEDEKYEEAKKLDQIIRNLEVHPATGY